MGLQLSIFDLLKEDEEEQVLLQEEKENEKIYLQEIREKASEKKRICRSRWGGTAAGLYGQNLPMDDVMKLVSRWSNEASRIWKETGYGDLIMIQDRLEREYMERGDILPWIQEKDGKLLWQGCAGPWAGRCAACRKKEPV